jgi:uncharacterized protein (DUF1015 family)
MRRFCIQKCYILFLALPDLRNDERIDYIPGKQSIVTIKEVIDEGEFELGFMLFPTDISEIKGTGRQQPDYASKKYLYRPEI